MFKTMLFIGAAALSFPALAQTTPPGADDPMAPPAQTDPAPVQSDPMTTTTPPDSAPSPDSTSPDSTMPPSDTTAPAPGEANQPAPSGAAATPAQVAQIVDQEFPTYDADSTQELNETEFATWMKKLRTATDPSVDPESEQVQTWIGQAFAAADTDKSGGVSKTELTGFLSRGA